ncbi:MAG: hypothetical protein JXB35_17740 [Anaerolineae bacterium]|nr:hypothetical protein [Anaerolineae bacterium]
MKTENSYRERQLAQATAELGYERRPPESSGAWDLTKVWWIQPPPSMIQMIVNGITTESWPMDFLRERIRALGVKPQGRSRQDLVKQFVDILLDPGRLNLVVEGFDNDTRYFYTLMLLNLKMGRWNEEGEPFLLTQELSRSPQDLMAHIIDAGLVIETGNGLAVPEAVFSRIPPLHLPAELFTSQMPYILEFQTKPIQLIAKIQQLLALLQREEPALRTPLYWTAQNTPYLYPRKGFLPAPEAAAALRKKRPEPFEAIKLMAPEPQLSQETLTQWSNALALTEAAVEFLFHLLLSTSILRMGSPARLEPEATEHFRGLAPGKQIDILIQAFRAMPEWSALLPSWREGNVQVEWNYVPYVDSRTFGYPLLLALMGLRIACLDFLAFLPHETWILVSETVNLLLQFLPGDDFLTAEGSVSLTDAEYTWRGALEKYLRALIIGPLHQLGLADVRLLPDGDLVGFRLHHLQDILWRRTDTFPLTETPWTESLKQIHWEAQEGLLLTLPMPAGVFNHVHKWAKPSGAIGDALRYEPDEERLYATFEDGDTLDTLIESWQEATGSAPPESLAMWWAERWQRYGCVRLYPQQAIIETEDSFTMQEIQVAIPALKDAVVALVNPQVALLQPHQITQVVTGLEKRGYLPKVVGKK